MSKPVFIRNGEMPVHYKPLPLHAVQPEGWLKAELKRNLQGFTGHLDSLVPELFARDDIYGKDRLSSLVKHKDVGALSDDGAFQTQFLWWNSETQSNWLDGFVRTAILLNDEAQLKKAKSIIERLLATQDPDGYIGIYSPDLRYAFSDENGELWSKTTLYRALLAWYEYTTDGRVLDAIERAVGNVMTHYPVHASRPFHSVNPNSGGVTHGLAFTDVLEQLYQLTGKKQYAEYIIFLYESFSGEVLNEDALFGKIMDQGKPLTGHGVHTYEHLRSVAAAYQMSGDPVLKEALDRFLKKITGELNPSGGPAGDEFIGGRKADATQTGYEFCSLQELMTGWISLLSKSGNGVYGDQAEQLYFNAAMGAVHPDESAICYLKTDNTFYLTGGKHGDTTDKNQTRYRYSPVHKEAAVCCVPNAGRIGPSYIEHMWMTDQDGPVATLFGPCTLRTRVGGQQIMITEITDYPFMNTIQFRISAAQEHATVIKVRKPAWAASVRTSVPYTMSGDMMVFSRTWKKEDVVEISFETSVQVRQAGKGQVSFMYGPLVLCAPLQGVQQITKTYPDASFRESIYRPLDQVSWQYTGETLVQPDKKKPEFRARLIDKVSGISKVVSMVPMFHTILRQVTFDVK